MASRCLFFAGCLFTFFSAAHAQSTSFSLTIHDDQIIPSELEVSAGLIELAGKNPRVAGSAELESDAQLRREKVVPAGEQVTVYVGPLRPRKYEFFDDFHPAVRGHLIVR